MNPALDTASFLRQRGRLLALLVVLHLVLLTRNEPVIGLLAWLADVGLFLLWQPFVSPERRLDAKSLLLLAALLGAGAWFFGDWLLIFWVTLLASLLGGRIMMFGHRPTRLFYLLAFAYLLAVLLGWLIPGILPQAAASVNIERVLTWSLPLVFPLMLMLPRAPTLPAGRGSMVDFSHILFTFLMITVLVLGALAFMLLRQSAYIEAVIETLISMALLLLFMALVWNPRSSLSGLGVFFSRYMLTLALPFDTWLQRLMEMAEQESDAERFMGKVGESLLELPWIVGGEWRPTAGEAAGTGRFGQASPHAYDFSHKLLVLRLYSAYAMSPSLAWHFEWLAKVAHDYYGAKLRARELEQMSYLRAVHETGARLTHDIKNLLQTLNNLCFAAQHAGEADALNFNAVVQRQLPQIVQRLRQTLDKLQAAPIDAGLERLAGETAAAWWAALKQRYADEGIEFAEGTFSGEQKIPSALFDSVAENLLQNALLKRRQDAGLHIRVSFLADAACLRVSDTGEMIEAAILRDLLRVPVVSANGLGIGLYSAARQAERDGYELRLADNAPGQVCFELCRLGAARALPSGAQ